MCIICSNDAVILRERAAARRRREAPPSGHPYREPSGTPQEPPKKRRSLLCLLGFHDDNCLDEEGLLMWFRCERCKREEPREAAFDLF